jgi:hypothetical protein
VRDKSNRARWVPIEVGSVAFQGFLLPLDLVNQRRAVHVSCNIMILSGRPMILCPKLENRFSTERRRSVMYEEKSADGLIFVYVPAS